jgi:hypothetical protein
MQGQVASMRGKKQEQKDEELVTVILNIVLNVGRTPPPGIRNARFACQSSLMIRSIYLQKPYGFSPTTNVMKRSDTLKESTITP